LNTSFTDQIANCGFATIDEALPEEIYLGLKQRFELLRAAELLEEAGIGSGGMHELNRRIRRDKVFWIQKTDEHPAVCSFMQWIDGLIDVFNRELFLSLRDGEFHFSHYPAGAFYRKHLDQFKERDNRQISVVLYFNDQWKPGDGGELKIFQEPEPVIIEPIGNRLVLFRSDTIAHEVLETKTSRLSLTGWLTRMPVGLGFLG
jgi:SM-20-related protein